MTKDEKEIIFNRLLELEDRHPAFAENVRDNAYCEAIADVKRIIERINETSLPSNLDEAANKFGFKETLERLREGEITRKNERMFRWQIEKAFKVGAEWMAGQGVKLKCWIARDEYSGDESDLYIGQQKPRRVPGAAPGFGMWCDYGEFMALPTDMFSELTYYDEPIEVELIIRKK